MRIVVSGTHAGGKSTLIGDFATRHADYRVLPDPYDELLDDALDEPDAVLFARQLEASARRLIGLPAGVDVIAERGPLDFLAYLVALDRLRRPGRSGQLLTAGHSRAQAVAERIDLLVLVPLEPDTRNLAGDDEDPELRDEMNEALLELADDPDLVGGRVIEVAGDPASRCAQVERALETPA